MKISVCIPTYNQALYLEQAIRSAANQNIPPYEIIVSNDCSTDNTLDLLQSLQKEISNLKIVNQPFNLGIVENTNCCLKLAVGEYIVRLDSDDYLLPNFTGTLLDGLKKFPDAGYAHGDVEEINHKGEILKVRRLFRKNCYQNGEEALRKALSGYKVAANIIMFRRSALIEVGFITISVDFAEDFHLSASLAANGFGNVYVNKVLSRYRVWEDTGKIRQKRKLSEIIGIRKVFEEVLEPAYKIRNWKLARIRKSRSDFASRHATCLGWDTYSMREKEEIANEILKLSSTTRAKMYIWIFFNGYGQILNTISSIKAIPKIIIKNFVFRLNDFITR